MVNIYMFLMLVLPLKLMVGYELITDSSRF